MEGLGDRAKAQQAKRDKLHASAVKRNNQAIKASKGKK